VIDNFRDFAPQSHFPLCEFNVEIVEGKIRLFGEVHAAGKKKLKNVL